MDGEVRNRRSKRKEREGGEGARNEPLLLLVTEIWGCLLLQQISACPDW